jgi:hypothetical protein
MPAPRKKGWHDWTRSSPTVSGAWGCVAYLKQDGRQNHYTPMKTNITAAIFLALGILSTEAFADNTTVLLTPALDRIAASPPSPGARDPASATATPDLTAKQIAQLEHDFNAKYQTNDGLAQNFADQVLPDTGVIFARAEFPTVVFSEPPSPAFYYDENAPAHWYLSVAFHFDWSWYRGG